MVTGVPASQWVLSTEGRRRCQSLAKHVATYEPAAIIASEEPKAVETGQIVARILGLPFETALGLHEHKRAVVRDLDSPDTFQAQVAAFFERPGELVLGFETADQAHARFTQALSRILERHSAGNLAIVSHGTVMTLLIARANHLDPLPFWRNLGLPASAVLSLPDLKLVEVVPQPGNAVDEISRVGASKRLHFK
jgi:broad specificity phosphatase PhoE